MHQIFLVWRAKSLVFVSGKVYMMVTVCKAYLLIDQTDWMEVRLPQFFQTEPNKTEIPDQPKQIIKLNLH